MSTTEHNSSTSDESWRESTASRMSIEYRCPKDLTWYTRWYFEFASMLRSRSREEDGHVINETFLLIEDCVCGEEHVVMYSRTVDGELEYTPRHFVQVQFDEGPSEVMRNRFYCEYGGGLTPGEYLLFAEMYERMPWSDLIQACRSFSPRLYGSCREVVIEKIICDMESRWQIKYYTKSEVERARKQAGEQGSSAEGAASLEG